MKLYDDPMSGNGYKARLLLAHLSRAYQYVPIDIIRGESRTQEFLKKNPNGRIPVLELDDGRCLPRIECHLVLPCSGYSLLAR